MVIEEVKMTTFVKDVITEGRGFTTKGARRLWRHLQAVAKECEFIPLTYDPAALCREFREYPSIIAAAKELGWQYEGEEFNTTLEEDALDYLWDQYLVINFKGGIILGGTWRD